MRRGSKTKEEDPDYWETSKPIKKDGMTAQTRNDPVKKEVVYLDFRAEVSAFDKIFHFAKGEDTLCILAGVNRNTKNPHSVSPSQEVRFS